jgi:hypothetical protein
MALRKYLITTGEKEVKQKLLYTQKDDKKPVVSTEVESTVFNTECFHCWKHWFVCEVCADMGDTKHFPDPLLCGKCKKYFERGCLRVMCGKCHEYKGKKSILKRRFDKPDPGPIDRTVRLTKHQADLYEGYESKCHHRPNYYWVKYHDMRKWLQYLVVNDIELYNRVKDYGTDPKNYDTFVGIVGSHMPPI